jgi:CheY-like chemotaxis protein
MRSSRPILLVEDDRVDVMTLERAMKDLNVTNPVVNVRNGEEALQYLRNEANQKLCLILLDLNMPKVNGIKFLQLAKADEMLKNIPVVMLTTSTEQQDITESFKLGAAGYMVKSIDYKRFVEIIKVIDLYWTLSELPNRG